MNELVKFIKYFHKQKDINNIDENQLIIFLTIVTKPFPKNSEIDFPIGKISIGQKTSIDPVELLGSGHEFAKLLKKCRIAGSYKSQLKIYNESLPKLLSKFSIDNNSNNLWNMLWSIIKLEENYCGLIFRNPLGIWNL